MGNTSKNDPFYQELGKALRKARLDADLSYSEAAASAGLSSSNVIGRYENATRTPSPKTIAALSVSYNMDTRDILTNALEAAKQVKKGNDGKKKEEE